MAFSSMINYRRLTAKQSVHINNPARLSGWSTILQGLHKHIQPGVHYESLLGFGVLGGVLPDKAGGLGVQQLVPEAAADQVGPLRQVEHGPWLRHCDAPRLQLHTCQRTKLPDQ